MPIEGLSMRHIREVLRLHYSVGLSPRAVARSLGLAQGTVSKYLNRTCRPDLALAAGCPAREQSPVSATIRSAQRRASAARFGAHARELRRPNVTLMLLWDGYCDASSDSFSYSWFCER